jgi:hypothetical protein
MRPRLTERLLSRVSNLGGEGCWEWEGSVSPEGHGRISRMRGDGFQQHPLVHRVVYEWLVGPIPQGLTIDHLCRNPRCVRPSHLEPVTNIVNVMRGVSPAAQNARKTHCHKGHELPPDYRAWRNKRMRSCKPCKHDAYLARLARLAQPDPQEVR